MRRLRCFLAVVCLAVLPGCSVLPKVKLPGIGQVSAFEDAGKPATIDADTERTGFRVPKNSKVTVVRTEPLPGEGFLLPGKTQWTVELPEPTDFMQEVRRIQASTGTVDTSVAMHKADLAERRWLLFVAVGCALAGLIIRSMLPAWPSLSNGLLLGAAVAGISWKLAEIPGWLWAVGILISLILVAGYKRAEWDKDKDGIPDFLQ